MEHHRWAVAPISSESTMILSMWRMTAVIETEVCTLQIMGNL